MGTTVEKLNKILDTKSNIRTAIINKGVNVPSDATFASYSTYIGEISTGTSDVQEVSTDTEMDSLLTDSNTGNYYNYIGDTTSNYIQDDLYEIITN